jgi:hypothetical protein
MNLLVTSLVAVHRDQPDLLTILAGVNGGQSSASLPSGITRNTRRNQEDLQPPVGPSANGGEQNWEGLLFLGD